MNLYGRYYKGEPTGSFMGFGIPGIGVYLSHFTILFCFTDQILTRASLFSNTFIFNRKVKLNCSRYNGTRISFFLIN